MCLRVGTWGAFTARLLPSLPGPPKAYPERKWPLSVPLLLEIRSTGCPSLQPGFQHSLVEVLETNEKRLRVRFMGAAQPVSWILRDSVSGVMVIVPVQATEKTELSVVQEVPDLEPSA